MPMLVQGLSWYLLLAAGGLGGALLLTRWGVGPGVAWAAGRPLVWIGAGYFAWLAGHLGVRQWWWAGLGVVLPLALAALRQRRRLLSSRVLVPEAVGAVTFMAIATLRLPVMEVTGTEKPMDLAILATLLRPGTLPPSDPWLAGTALPYYYWGFVPWVLPAQILRLLPDEAFNLLVPAIAAVTAQLAWALARALGCGRRAATLAAFLAVFAGTLDGWLQLAGGTPLAGLDLWRSSRAIAGAITEFPLFTFHLGDLHPHVLSLPPMLLAILLASTLALPGNSCRAPWPVVALVYGGAAAANPWCALPAGLAVLAAAMATGQRPERPQGTGLQVWARVAAVGAGGWALYFPFWAAYRTPVGGLGLVHTATRLDELALFLGAMLAPVALVALELVKRMGGFEPARRQLATALAAAAVVVLIVITRRPALAVALVGAIVLARAAARGRLRPVRPAWALSAVALALLAAMEIIYVRDPYGGELYRMNTVFKATHIAFALLAVCVPALLAWLRARRPLLATAAVALVVLAGVPHLAALALRVPAAEASSWTGLGWMVPGEEAAARWLFRRRGAAVLAEGVGEAYSSAARIASASGVPVALGWENHERVWRGGGIEGELRRRRKLVETIYASGSAAEVRSAVAALGVTHVVIGSVERSLYPGADFAALRAIGIPEFAAAECEVLRVGGER